MKRHDFGSGAWSAGLACVALTLSAFLALGQTNAPVASENTNTPPNMPEWLTRPISLVDSLNLALQGNATILEAKHDLEASYGVVVQTRAILIPKVAATGNYTSQDPELIEPIPGVPTTFPHESWSAGIEVVQSVYEGGRMRSALRTARLTKEQALLNYQTSVEDVLLRNRVAYYDVLVGAQQIEVNEASVNLLTKELEDQQRRYDAGTVPRFNVLRAEVAVANARPPLIRARNDYRIAKNVLVTSLGYNLPRDVWEDIPLHLTDKLEATPFNIALPTAITQAMATRTELAALRKAEQLQAENVVTARAGYKPSLQAFAGWDWHSSQFNADLNEDFDGWVVGGRISWNIFDGMLTRGKVMEAKALHERSKTELDDNARRIELEVRTAYSTFIQAREVLDSQVKVQEQAEEALRLAKARADAGTATQLDVLDAETSLTQARSTQVEALHDYVVARARLERAIGQNMMQVPGH